MFAASALCPSTNAQPAADKPRYLQLLERQYRSGDWVLQCDSWVACRILGVAAPGDDASESRPVVMIDRGWKKDALYRIQIAFIDSYGQIRHANPDATWRAGARGGAQTQFQFDLAASSGRQADLVPQNSVNGLIDRLSQVGPIVLDDGAGRRLRLPRGDLAGLLRRMDRLQRPAQNPLAAAERSAWLKQYRYAVKRGQPATGVTPPDDVILACHTRTQARYWDAWRLDSDHMFWIAHCPEGSRMFLQKGGAAPVPFNLSRFGGGEELDVYSRFDPDTSLLTVKLSETKRGDCGHRVRFGWTDAQSFGMIEHRRLTMCRHVPADFWPMVWTPTSWRYAGEPPLSAGDAAPPNEAVKSPQSSE